MPKRRRPRRLAITFLTAVAALVVAGCTGATQLLPVNGSRHIIVRCTGATTSGCMARASQECSGAYEILEIGKGSSTNLMRVRCVSGSSHPRPTGTSP